MKTHGLLLCLVSILTLQMFGQTNNPESDLISTAKAMTPNLLLNPGAEDGLDNWTMTQGVSASLIAFDCNGIEPYADEYYFAVGGLCEFSEVEGILTQDIDVSIYADSIATGDYQANFGGYFSNWVGEDIPEMRLLYLDGADGLLGSSTTLSSVNDSWTMVSATEMIPLGTATIQVELKGTQIAGSFNDSYFDELFVWLEMEEAQVSTQELSHFPASLKVTPNPAQSVATIELPYAPNGSINFSLTDLAGSQTPCSVKYYSDRIVILNNGELNGLYLFTVTSDSNLIGRGKVLFIP